MTLRRLVAPLLLAGLSLAGCASVPATGTRQIADSTLSYTLLDNGAPTVVLQSGLGDDRAPWAGILPILAARYTVFAYDRPGYGASGTASSSRDACAIADELHALLQASGARPPYVLVGHSLGGLYQYVFARLYPDEVAGLVLVDATHPDHWRHLQAEVPALASLLKGMRTTVFSPAMRQEFDAQDQCLDRIARTPALGIPTRVLARTRYDLMEQGAYEAMVHREEQDWLALTGARRVEAVAAAGHYIQRDQPQTVISAIEAIAGTAQAR
ncbi:alpha/beta fold hydrolase [Chitiniphilus eburneus]|uniref:Alpha/beta hydrolase n=1 Tax=Chitiniphilus eburneus TaxID=2571148 RepID=A0A4U0Q3A5_9NEIS|nr:alpha/beta fold hydrolase [Chitiniphilus eburneus]TJZ75537.1 alpha/beta hydrolase [Chitiniphilus eburneus]